MLHPNQTRTTQIQDLTPTNPSNLLLMPTPTGTRTSSPALLDVVVIASRRCSSFFAEAAVLVLVFGLLDYFMLKGRIELPWIIGALVISIALLACSIATDFLAQRWVRAYP
jgi:hypothetical protein